MERPIGPGVGFEGAAIGPKVEWVPPDFIRYDTILYDPIKYKQKQ